MKYPKLYASAGFGVNPIRKKNGRNLTGEQIAQKAMSGEWSDFSSADMEWYKKNRGNVTRINANPNAPGGVEYEGWLNTDPVYAKGINTGKQLGKDIAYGAAALGENALEGIAMPEAAAAYAINKLQGRDTKLANILPSFYRKMAGGDEQQEDIIEAITSKNFVQNNPGTALAMGFMLPGVPKFGKVKKALHTIDDLRDMRKIAIEGLEQGRKSIENVENITSQYEKMPLKELEKFENMSDADWALAKKSIDNPYIDPKETLPRKEGRVQYNKEEDWNASLNKETKEFGDRYHNFVAEHYNDPDIVKSILKHSNTGNRAQKESELSFLRKTKENLGMSNLEFVKRGMDKELDEFNTQLDWHNDRIKSEEFNRAYNRLWDLNEGRKESFLQSFGGNSKKKVQQKLQHLSNQEDWINSRRDWIDKQTNYMQTGDLLRSLERSKKNQQKQLEKLEDFLIKTPKDPLERKTFREEVPKLDEGKSLAELTEEHEWINSVSDFPQEGEFDKLKMLESKVELNKFFEAGGKQFLEEMNKPKTKKKAFPKLFNPYTTKIVSVQK